jgi:hypothetical protein
VLSKHDTPPILLYAHRLGCVSGLKRVVPDAIVRSPPGQRATEPALRFHFHSLTHSLTHLLTHSLTYSLTHSLAYLDDPSKAHLRTHGMGATSRGLPLGRCVQAGHTPHAHVLPSARYGSGGWSLPDDEVPTRKAGGPNVVLVMLKFHDHPAAQVASCSVPRASA